MRLRKLELQEHQASQSLYEEVFNLSLIHIYRDPSMTEIRVLDTYWSDHCRHTTFSTELKDVSFGEGDYREPIEDTYKQYLSCLLYTSSGRCILSLAAER